MKSRRFIIAVLAMILIFILGYLGNDGAIMAIASVAIGVAGAAAADIFSEKRYQQPTIIKQKQEVPPPSPKCLDEDE